DLPLAGEDRLAVPVVADRTLRGGELLGGPGDRSERPEDAEAHDEGADPHSGGEEEGPEHSPAPPDRLAGRPRLRNGVAMGTVIHPIPPKIRFPLCDLGGLINGKRWITVPEPQDAHFAAARTSGRVRYGTGVSRAITDEVRSIPWTSTMRSITRCRSALLRATTRQSMSA